MKRIAVFMLALVFMVGLLSSSMAVVYSASGLEHNGVITIEPAAPDDEFGAMRPEPRASFLVVDRATISNNGVSWIHPSSHPYARIYITNTSNETMTVTFTHPDGGSATFTVSANSSIRLLGRNYRDTIRISFSTSSGVGTGTVSVRASTVPLS